MTWQLQKLSIQKDSIRKIISAEHFIDKYCKYMYVYMYIDILWSQIAQACESSLLQKYNTCTGNLSKRGDMMSDLF